MCRLRSPAVNQQLLIFIRTSPAAISQPAFFIAMHRAMFRSVLKIARCIAGSFFHGWLSQL